MTKVIAVFEQISEGVTVNKQGAIITGVENFENQMHPFQDICDAADVIHSHVQIRALKTLTTAQRELLEQCAWTTGTHYELVVPV